MLLQALAYTRGNIYIDDIFINAVNSSEHCGKTMVITT